MLPGDVFVSQHKSANARKEVCTMKAPSQMSRTTVLVEGALMVAVAYVLSMIPFVQLPWGGSITAFSTHSSGIRYWYVLSKLSIDMFTITSANNTTPSSMVLSRSSMILIPPPMATYSLHFKDCPNRNPYSFCDDRIPSPMATYAYRDDALVCKTIH